MTVSELIELLQELNDQSANIVYCDNEFGDIQIEEIIWDGVNYVIQ